MYRRLSPTYFRSFDVYEAILLVAIFRIKPTFQDSNLTVNNTNELEYRRDARENNKRELVSNKIWRVSVE